MEAEDIGAIPVLEGEELHGMVTDRDIVVRAVAKGKDPRGMPVREISSREIVTVSPDQDLSDAVLLMAQNQVRRIPVVDDRESARRRRFSGRRRARGQGEDRR